MSTLLVILGTIAAGAFVARSVPTEELLQDRFALGQRYYAANDHENSVELFSQIESTPNFPLLNVDDIDVAIDELVLPLRVAATYQLGNSYRNVGRTLLERSRSLTVEGDSTAAAARRVESNVAFDQARDYYRRLVADDDKAPLNVRVMSQYQVVRASYQTEDYPSVVAETEILLSTFPGSDYEDAALYDRGWAYYHMGEYRRAIGAFQRLLDVSEDALKRDRAIFQTGESHSQLGEQRAARSWYARLVDAYDFSALSEKELLEMKTQRLRGLVQETTRELVAKAQIRIADSYAAEGRTEEAIAAYSRVPVQFPQETLLVQKSYDNMATMVLERQGVDPGVRVLRQAIEQVDDPLFRGRVQLRIASVLFRDGRFREAIAEYDVYERAYGSIALSVGVGLDQVRFTVAEAHRELAREAGAPEYELARAAYHAVVSDYPSSPRVPEALYGLGHSLYGLAELEAAAGEFATVVEAFPQAQVAAHAQSWRARLAYLAGDGEQAASLYRELISAYPNSELIDQTWKDLGLVYKGLDQTEAATEALSRVDPGFAAWPKVQAEAADMLLAAGQIDRIESQLDLDEALRRAAAAGDGESVAEIHYVLGRVGRARGDHAAEVEHFTQVQAHSGNEGLASFAGFFRGLAFYQLGSAADAAGDSAAGSGHFTAAVNDLESVLATDNSEMRSIAYRTRGIALTRLGRSSEAVGAYEALIAGAPSAQERAEFELMLMELYFDLGQLEQTKTAARQLIAADFVDESGGFSFKERAHFVLVSVLLEQELYDQAHTAATAALRRYPRSANRSTLILTSARSLFFSERYETSATAFQRFIDENPTHPELGSAYLQLGYCREILGEYEAAATAFQALARNLPSDPLVPDALYRAGENLYNLSRFEAALGLFVQVVEDHPRSNSAEMALYSASWTYMDLDRENDSLAAMRRLVDDYPGSGYARFAQFSIGDYLYSKKRFEEAQAAYEQVLQRFPGTSEADKAEGLLTDLEEDLASREYDEVFTDFQAGRYAAAASAFEAIFESYPDSYSALAALANKGVALEHLGNSTEARSTYERVLTAAGERPESSDIANFARLRLENL